MYFNLTFTCLGKLDHVYYSSVNRVSANSISQYVD